MYEYEGETEFEWEGEGESEYEGEGEAEEFFGRLATWARTQWGTQGSPLRRVALGAARAAVNQGSQALGGALGGRLGQRDLGQRLGTVVGSGLQTLIPQSAF